MIRVNLVPQEILDRELQKQRLAQFSVAAAAVAVVFLLFSFGHYYKSVRLAKELEKDQAEFKRLEAIVKQVEALEAEAKAVKAHLDVIQDLLAARPFYPRFMTELVKGLGEGIWLESLKVAGKTPNELAVTMGCSAVSVEAATRWLRQLNDSAVFKDPAMGDLTVTNDNIVTFNMNVRYLPAAAGGKK